MNFLLDGLNEAQKKVVLRKDGPLLVLAGAGSGKTKSISHRIAYLVAQGVAPEKILAITFTNKAANEMKERIFSLLKRLEAEILPVPENFDDPPGSKQPGGTSKFSGTGKHPFISTFHTLGVYILRRSGEKVGAPKNFSILDKDESLSLVKEALKELSIDPKQFQPNKMQSIISREKGDLMDWETYSNEAGSDFYPSMIARIWKKYEELLAAQKALDFDDLVSKVVFLLKKDETARNYYQNLWDYIIIDEYQDTNKSQYELSKLLSARHKNICAIGDMDQSIYGFRGADFRNIINFERDFPNLVSIALEENYRSTQNILEAAAKVIEKNKVRKAKGLYTKNVKGAEISLFEAMGENEEAEFVIHKIKEVLASGVSPSDVAVLFRANFQSRVFEEMCLKHGVPYQMLGVQFYERKEVKDVFAYLRAAANRQDLLSIKRIINVPPRGLGKVSIANKFAGKKLPPAAEKKFQEFMDLLDSINKAGLSKKTSEVVAFVLRETGMEKFLEEGDGIDQERLENVKELVSIATKYDHCDPPEGTDKMLEDAALMSAQDSMDMSGQAKKETIRLMTVHAAKGLEFKNVFIAGLEEGLFPHSGFGDRSGERDEEERRLFYVAVTRAKEKLWLSFSVIRTVFGSKQMNMPSRFLSDIPDHLYKMEQFKFQPEDVIRYE
ncbi:ATP-dependent DNA helicase PcrA [Candidatus Parcubacteria bacterium]|nr:MAG: ATP-dependent DNA helicase PcrA [Candidatus Parcubacteria bacterium]